MRRHSGCCSFPSTNWQPALTETKQHLWVIGIIGSFVVISLSVSKRPLKEGLDDCPDDAHALSANRCRCSPRYVSLACMSILSRFFTIFENMSRIRILSACRHYWPEACGLVRFSWKRLNEERLPQLAGSLTYTSILGLVPLLAIALAVFTMFPQFGTLKTTLNAYFVQFMIPKEIANTVMGYLTLFSAKAARVSAVGALVLLITASLMIRMVERSFNQVWRVRVQRPLYKRIGLYVAIAVLGPFFMGVSLSLTSHLYLAARGVVGGIPLLNAFLFEIVTILWTIGAYTLLYWFVPNRTVEWRDAIAGGLFSAFAFEVAKRIFAAFILHFSNYGRVYGAVATIPVLLIWMYLTWLITLVGAVVSATMPIVKYGRWKHVPYPGSVFKDAMKVLRALYQAKLTLSNSVEGKNLPALTQLGADEIENLLQVMLSAGWVAHIGADVPIRVRRWRKIAKGRSERWVLTADPEKLTLASVYRLFVFKGDGSDELTKKVELAIEQGLQETLASHFSKS